MPSIFGEYRDRLRRAAQRRRRFTVVHDGNLWGSGETRSGLGSARNSHSVVAAAAAIRKAVNENAIRSISDIPCGDFHWMPDVLNSLDAEVAYTGFDIVFSALQANKDRYPRHDFRLLDIVSAVPPRADLIFCKDLLNHLPDAEVVCAVTNFIKSGSKFLLASNNAGFAYAPLPEAPGGSRHLDITAPPFGYNPPLWTIDGYLGFWRLRDIGPCRP